MIKLKIGDNYLLTCNEDALQAEHIIYMMSCFRGHNQVALGLSSNIPSRVLDDLTKKVAQERLDRIYLLSYLAPVGSHQGPSLLAKHITRDVNKMFIERLRAQAPNTQVLLIKMNNDIDSKRWHLGKALYSSLEQDKRCLLANLPILDEYKRFQTRFKNIPGELKVVNDSIKSMSKEKKVCDRKITLQTVEYLNLIDKVEVGGMELYLTLKPLAIYPSEDLGRCITAHCFKTNPYLFEAAKHIYLGGHFGMPGTQILVRSDFRPEFIKTLDHQFDDMFHINNWSDIGYPHFGRNHFCGGEFNDVIAHTAEHGLEYYFICLKQYLTTANMRDYAGKKVWWYPIYNDAGELIYCAGLAIMKDRILHSSSYSDETKEQIKNMSWTEFNAWRIKKDLQFKNLRTEYMSENISQHSNNADMFLEVCKEQDQALYEQIMERRK